MINQDFNSILELIKAFPDEQTCIDHLTALRWEDEVVSPFDAESKVYVCKGNKYKCKNTGKYFNVKTATLFDNTKIPLQKWFLAIWLVTSHKKGISSIQLSKDISVTQKSAWFMLQRIRNCFGNDIELNNEVEVDETFIGAPTKNKSIRKRIEIHKNGVQTGMNDKVPVLGMVERSILGIYHFTSKKHLQMYVDEFVFRYNSREESEAQRFNLMLANTEFRLTYKELIHG